MPVAVARLGRRIVDRAGLAVTMPVGWLDRLTVIRTAGRTVSVSMSVSTSMPVACRFVVAFAMHPNARLVVVGVLVELARPVTRVEVVAGVFGLGVVHGCQDAESPGIMQACARTTTWQMRASGDSP
jgi:hypothetical protein